MKAKGPVARMKDDDDQTHFLHWTSIVCCFQQALECVLSQMISAQCTGCCFSAGDQLLLFLMKLRLALPHQELAYNFGIQITKVTKVEWRLCVVPEVGVC